MIYVVYVFAIIGALAAFNKLLHSLRGFDTYIAKRRAKLTQSKALERSVRKACKLFSSYSKGQMLYEPALGTSKEHLANVIRVGQAELEKNLEVH